MLQKIISFFTALWERVLGEYTVDEQLLGYQVVTKHDLRYFIREYKRIQKFQRFGVCREHVFYRVSRFNEKKTLEFRVCDDNDLDIIKPSGEMIVQQFIAIEVFNEAIERSRNKVIENPVTA